MSSSWCWVLTAALLVLPRMAGAFMLLWECPLDSGGAPCAWSRAKPTWTLQQTRSTGGETTQTSVPFTPLAPEDCAALPAEVWEGGYMPERDWCADVPCPGAGAYNLMLIVGDVVWSDKPLQVGLDGDCQETAYDGAVRTALPVSTPTGEIPTVPSGLPAVQAPGLSQVPAEADAPIDAAEETLPLTDGAVPEALPTLPPMPADDVSDAGVRAVEAITAAYERRQAEIRAWYEERRQGTGTRLARLQAQWQAYHTGMAQLQEAYRKAYQQALEALTPRVPPPQMPASPGAP